MRKLFTLILGLAFVLAVSQETDNRSKLYKEESKDVDNIVNLMKDKCIAYQFSLDWVKVHYDEDDPRRQKFEDEVMRKFLKDCKNKDLDEFEEKARLSYTAK